MKVGSGSVSACGREHGMRFFSYSIFPAQTSVQGWENSYLDSTCCVLLFLVPKFENMTHKMLLLRMGKYGPFERAKPSEKEQFSTLLHSSSACHRRRGRKEWNLPPPFVSPLLFRFKIHFLLLLLDSSSPSPLHSGDGGALPVPPFDGKQGTSADRFLGLPTAGFAYFLGTFLFFLSISQTFLVWERGGGGREEKGSSKRFCGGDNRKILRVGRGREKGEKFFWVWNSPTKRKIKVLRDNIYGYCQIRYFTTAPAN